MRDQHERLASLLTQAGLLLPAWRQPAGPVLGEQVARALAQVSAALDKHLSDEELDTGVGRVLPGLGGAAQGVSRGGRHLTGVGGLGQQDIGVPGQHRATSGQPDPGVGHEVRQQPRRDLERPDAERGAALELVQGVSPVQRSRGRSAG